MTGNERTNVHNGRTLHYCTCTIHACTVLHKQNMSIVQCTCSPTGSHYGHTDIPRRRSMSMTCTARGHSCMAYWNLANKNSPIFARLKSNVWLCLNLSSIGVTSTALTRVKNIGKKCLRLMSFSQHFGKHLKSVWCVIFVIYKNKIINFQEKLHRT